MRGRKVNSQLNRQAAIFDEQYDKPNRKSTDFFSRNISRQAAPENRD